jgi:hypothetical protein
MLAYRFEVNLLIESDGKPQPLKLSPNYNNLLKPQGFYDD